MPKGRTWTPEDLAELERLADSGLAHAEIGSRLGRSTTAVTSQLHAVRRGRRQTARRRLLARSDEPDGPGPSRAQRIARYTADIKAGRPIGRKELSQ